jgi:hypothetical protein
MSSLLESDRSAASLEVTTSFCDEGLTKCFGGINYKNVATKIGDKNVLDFCGRWILDFCCAAVLLVRNRIYGLTFARPKCVLLSFVANLIFFLRGQA